jgi:hypothetical protein
MVEEHAMSQTTYRAVVAPPGEKETSPVLMCSRCELPTRHRHVEDRERTWRGPSGAGTSGSRVFARVYGCLACGERREFGVMDEVEAWKDRRLSASRC